MSEDWIGARRAREMVSAARVGYDSELAILRFASAGQVQARATSFIVTQRNKSIEHTDHEICKEFWGSNGSSPPEDDWEIGWFSNWLENGIYCEAFGVTFARADIEKLLLPSDEIKNSAPLQVLGNRPQGGAPGKYDWARAVGTVIFKWADAGDWQPTSQAAVRKELENWFSENGQSPDDKQLKFYSRWLFREFHKRKAEGE